MSNHVSIKSNLIRTAEMRLSNLSVVAQTVTVSFCRYFLKLKRIGDIKMRCFIFLIVVFFIVGCDYSNPTEVTIVTPEQNPITITAVGYELIDGYDAEFLILWELKNISTVTIDSVRVEFWYWANTYSYVTSTKYIGTMQPEQSTIIPAWSKYNATPKWKEENE